MGTGPPPMGVNAPRFRQSREPTERGWAGCGTAVGLAATCACFGTSQACVHTESRVCHM